MSKVHWYSGGNSEPACGRVPRAIARCSTNPSEVTCGWCLRLVNPSVTVEP